MEPTKSIRCLALALHLSSAGEARLCLAHKQIELLCYLASAAGLLVALEIYSGKPHGQEPGGDGSTTTCVTRR